MAGRYRSQYRNFRRSGGASRSTYQDREWKGAIIEQVTFGILQVAGVVPPPNGGGGILALMAGQQPATTTDTLYMELGRKVGEALGALALRRVAAPDGTVLVDPAKFGYYLAGQEPGFLDGMATAIGEGVETMTGGLISPDGGGIDADALAMLGTLAKALV